MKWSTVCDIILSAIVAGTLYTGCLDPAIAQSPVSVIGPVTAGDCTAFSSTTIIKDSGISGCSSGSINPKTLNTVRFASQYAGADWCVKLVAAIADLGAVPGTIVVDSAAVPSACTAGSTILIGAYHDIVFVSGNIYILNQTLRLGSGSRLVGIGGGDGLNPPIAQGTVLKWTGATGQTMVYMFDVAFAEFRDLALDGNNTTNIVGIQIDSDNSPTSTINTLIRFKITGVHFGVVVGSQSGTAVSGASCNVTPSQDGCSENDFFKIEQFQIMGNCADTTAEGIHINSLNAGQNSEIRRGNFQCTNKSVNLINMNDNLLITEVNSGSAIGASPAQFFIASSVINGPDLINNECEGTAACIVDHATGGAQTWAYNQINTACSSDGGAIISSQSNLGTVGSCTAGGTVLVKSYADNPANLWTASGGTVVISPDPSNPEVVSVGGTGRSTLTANAFLTGNGTTAINQVVITGLVLGNGASAPTAYAGTSCTNQFPRSLSASGVATCASVAIGSDVSGLGTGVATFLATPTSANLAGALTDETGSGSAVFAVSPSLTTPTIGAATYTSLQNTANSIATITAEKTGGDVFAYRFASTNPRMVFGIGGASGTPFFGYNVVFSSGNVWNIDKTGAFWFAGDPGGSGSYIIGTGTGTAGTTAGTDVQTNWRLKINTVGHVDYTNNNPPVPSACGTSPSLTGNDVVGTIITGTGNPTGCTITFANAFTSTPHCAVSWHTNLASMSYTVSTTAITITQTATSNNTIEYQCKGS